MKLKNLLKERSVIAMKFISAIAAILFIVAGCMLDSNSYVPHIICSLCLVWFIVIRKRLEEWANE